MKPTKLFHVLFSMVVIAALVFASVPMTSAHALSTTSTRSTGLATIGGYAPTLISGIVMCRSIIVWRHGHRITVRVCHRVHRQEI
jgi:hypothetical protein